MITGSEQLQPIHCRIQTKIHEQFRWAALATVNKRHKITYKKKCRQIVALIDEDFEIMKHTNLFRDFDFCH